MKTDHPIDLYLRSGPEAFRGYLRDGRHLMPFGAEAECRPDLKK